MVSICTFRVLLRWLRKDSEKYTSFTKDLIGSHGVKKEMLSAFPGVYAVCGVGLEPCQPRQWLCSSSSIEINSMLEFT